MNFNYLDEYQKLLTPEIVSYLSDIHEYKGRQFYYTAVKKDVLDEMHGTARFQSIESSNRIDGISTSEHRLKPLAADKGMPRGDNERIIAGYRDVWNTIHKNYEFLPLTPDTIMEFHLILYKYYGTANKGKFRKTNHIIPAELLCICSHELFIPMQYEEIPDVVQSICEAFNQAKSFMDPLLLIPMFICDFLRITPFGEGNGRISRLLLLLLLARCGYHVGSYSSIEKQIEKNYDDYHDTLESSLVNTGKETVDYVPFTECLLKIITMAYRDFIEKASIMGNKSYSKSDQVRETIKRADGEITKTEVLRQCGNISQTTVQRSLNWLWKSNIIIKIGGGRYTSYKWNGENK